MRLWVLAGAGREQCRGISRGKELPSPRGAAGKAGAGDLINGLGRDFLEGLVGSLLFVRVHQRVNSSLIPLVACAR